MDPFDKSRCSFEVPDFASDDEEREWVASLAPVQRMELLHLVQIARWGEDTISRPIDRSRVETLTMDGFNRMKEAEDAAGEQWRRAHGWPPRIRR